MEGYDDNENAFEFLCSLSNEKPIKQPVNSQKFVPLTSNLKTMQTASAL